MTAQHDKTTQWGIPRLSGEQEPSVHISRENQKHYLKTLSTSKKNWKGHSKQNTTTGFKASQ